MTKRDRNENFAIRVTLSPEQARAVVSALDLFTRIKMGQIKEIGYVLSDRNGRGDEVERILRELKIRLFPELEGEGSFHGISECTYRDAKVGYDVLQVIRRAEAYGRMPEGPTKYGHITSFNEPLFVSDATPRPKAETLGLLELLATAGDDRPAKPKKRRR